MNDPDRDELIFGDPGDRIDFSESEAEKILAFDPDTLNDDEAIDTNTFENGLAVVQEAVEMIPAGRGAVNSNHTPVLREPADYDEYTNDKKNRRGGSRRPKTQIDVTDLPTEAIVRMRELPAQIITSEVHPFASSYVEPIEKMDLPDSATKRMAFYCTLDMIQAGRNKSITDARTINEARPTLKRIRRENLQTIDFWPNHADGALPYVLRTRDGRRWWAVPLFAETVADDRPDLHMIILDVFANDLGNGGRVGVNDNLFGDIVLITSFMALPNSRLADIVSTFDNIHRTESHRFLAVKEFYLLKREFSETQVIQIPLRAPRGNVFCVARGQTLRVTARTNLFTAKGIKNELGANAIATLFHPKLHPGQFLKSILEDDYATILQLTNGHLTSDPTTPSVVTIKHLSRRGAEDFDAMPQPFRRFNGDKGKALAALVECAFVGFTGILAAANKNRDVRAYATTVTNCTRLRAKPVIHFTLSGPSGPPPFRFWHKGTPCHAFGAVSSARSDLGIALTREPYASKRVGNGTTNLPCCRSRTPVKEKKQKTGPGSVLRYGGRCKGDQAPLGYHRLITFRRELFTCSAHEGQDNAHASSPRGMRTVGHRKVASLIGFSPITKHRASLCVFSPLRGISSYSGIFHIRQHNNPRSARLQAHSKE
uniref:Uncharacterized protein n=1 Tax=Caenorhabditis japonica TaxID=281687 RepID=A0A8R1E581_CAEJA